MSCARMESSLPICASLVGGDDAARRAPQGWPHGTWSGGEGQPVAGMGGNADNRRPPGSPSDSISVAGHVI